jgi:ADP-ribosylglycohydrolase/8-oxo-dGTP pyrophosphatase MutT (NUDIX family)
MARRRGTAIVETPQGILVAAGRHGAFLLPGGGAERGEYRETAAIRELKEETGLKGYHCKYLFTHHAPHIDSEGRRTKHRDLHKVFLIKALGEPKPNYRDVCRIDFWKPGSSLDIDKTTSEIIHRYLKHYKTIAHESDFDKTLLEKYKFNKCQNLLLGTAFGDAFGVAFEGQNRRKVHERFQLDHYTRKRNKKSGKYTDDTQMSIAIAELLLAGEEFSIINLASKFLEVYRRNPHSGYGSSVREGLKRARNAEEFLRIIPGNKPGNGACMRAAPIGVLPRIEEVIKYAKLNAEITHNVPSAIASSVCVAAASHYFYHNLGKPEKVFDYCIKACKDIDEESIDYFKTVRDMKKLDPALLFGEEKEFYGVPVNGMRTAGAVLYIISRFYKDPAETLKEAILLGGDTDSTGSICLGIVAMRTGINKLPFFLFRDLENRGYGRDYLIELGEELNDKYPPTSKR